MKGTGGTYFCSFTKALIFIVLVEKAVVLFCSNTSDIQVLLVFLPFFTFNSHFLKVSIKHSLIMQSIALTH